MAGVSTALLVERPSVDENMEVKMHAVIMAGGSGTRFWPISRKRKPKQFLAIFGEEPMVVETCNRLKPLVQDEDMIIVLGREHLPEAEGLLKGRGIHMLAEPVGRNTAACIGLGALYAEHTGCEGPVAFLPADHFIGDIPAFREGLQQAAAIAAPGKIVTVGITPSRPETGYGYIERAAALDHAEEFRAFNVSAFVEKPDIETAKKYLAGGRHFWNGGIFVATPDTILGEIEKHIPILHDGLERLRQALGKQNFDKELEEVYEGIESVSFDNGIMEKTENPVLVVPCNCGWSDVGSWASLYEMKAEDYDPDRNLAEGETLLIECRDSYVSGRSGRLVVCLGLDHCLVVDTPDALLVTEIERSQEIRKVVEQLKGRKREKLL
ncbi:mannose-1-phosphate guanylyltransferase [Thermodesulfobacteriota bacterium]